MSDLAKSVAFGRGKPARPTAYTYAIWPSINGGGYLYVAGMSGHRIQVPGWVADSWRAGEPVEPLLDYLLENDLAPPDLAEAIREAYGPG